MSPLFLLLRLLNLAAAFGAVWLGARGRTAGLAAPTAAALAVAALEASLAFSGRPAGAAARSRAALACSTVEAALIAWLSFTAPSLAGAFDLAYLTPAVLTALEYGAAAGAAAGLAPAAFTALLIARGPGPDGESFLPVALVRTVFFIVAPAAAGLAAPAARADGAARARGTLARLRAAQVGEYISFVLFQLRDYLITITSVTEAVALSIPKEDAKLVERVERLRKSAGELSMKMSRLLGDKSALTAMAPPTSTAVDLAALTREIAAEARAAFAPGGPALDVIVQGDVPPAKTERRPIELALLAVLQNSLEACAARGTGGVTILLRREGDAAEIEVSDDGGGISEAMKPLVFEPLASTRSGGVGMGLGLSMSRRFLERLGGGLRLKSKGGCTAALLVVPLDKSLPQVRNEESTWAGRR